MTPLCFPNFSGERVWSSNQRGYHPIQELTTTKLLNFLELPATGTSSNNPTSSNTSYCIRYLQNRGDQLKIQQVWQQTKEKNAANYNTWQTKRTCRKPWYMAYWGNLQQSMTHGKQSETAAKKRWYLHGKLSEPAANCDTWQTK